MLGQTCWNIWNKPMKLLWASRNLGSWEKEEAWHDLVVIKESWRMREPGMRGPGRPSTVSSLWTSEEPPSWQPGRLSSMTRTRCWPRCLTPCLHSNQVCCTLVACLVSNAYPTVDSKIKNKTSCPLSIWLPLVTLGWPTVTYSDLQWPTVTYSNLQWP